MIESSGATYLAIPVILSIASSKLVADILMPVAIIECSMRAKRQRFIPPRISENTTELSIKDLMTSPVVCILETETVAATCAVLNAFPFGLFPVVNTNGQLVGIASRTDVETKIRDAQQNDTVRINFGGKKIPITTIRPDSTINHGHMLWNSLGLAIIPVTDTSNRLEGVITRSNLFRGIKN
jgi:CBS domain-containing protein